MRPFLFQKNTVARSVLDPRGPDGFVRGRDALRVFLWEVHAIGLFLFYHPPKFVPLVLLL
jgi:hypothetical protein